VADAVDRSLPCFQFCWHFLSQQIDVWNFLCQQVMSCTSRLPRQATKTMATLHKAYGSIGSIDIVKCQPQSEGS